jgi:hypothetical protein
VTAEHTQVPLQRPRTTTAAGPTGRGQTPKQHLADDRAIATAGIAARYAGPVMDEAGEQRVRGTGNRVRGTADGLARESGSAAGVGVEQSSSERVRPERSSPAVGGGERSQAWSGASGQGPVSYHHMREAKHVFRRAIKQELEAGCKRVCDVGGARRPVLPLPSVREHGLDYVILDESRVQLDRTPDGYQLVNASILDRNAVAELVREHGGFEVVISRWTAEHIPDGRLFHEQVFSMLRPGGRAIHLFPTLYALPFVLNRVLSAEASAALLRRVAPTRRNKFPGLYRWCRGPSRRQLARLASVGFSVERYAGFFGHDLYARVAPLDRAHRVLTDVLVDHPLPSMTSFAVVVLSRPA